MASHSASVQAATRAKTKYTKNKLDRIEIRCQKESGFKAEITEHAAKQGESVNAFITRAIKECIANDNKKTQ